MSRGRFVRPCAALAVALVAEMASTSVRAQIDSESKKQGVAALRVVRPPQIDGQLDDEPWAGAAVAAGFRQVLPHEGRPVSELTEVRVTYDDRAIYIGVRCGDAAPDGIVARMTRRDRLVESDWVQVTLDSRHDHHTGAVFRLNAGGIQFDALAYDDTQMNPEWDAVWAGAVGRDAGGWNAEFAIPLSVLRFPNSPSQTWGLQVTRYISRKKETASWTYWPRSAPGGVSYFGHLASLNGLKPRRTVQFQPFVVARQLGQSAAGMSVLGRGGVGRRTQTQLDGGLDLKLGLTSELTLDMTVNPDFGQIEADPAVLNLSRFEIIFPEKRPFFLEGTDVFLLPETETVSAQSSYSRRIGADPVAVKNGSLLLVNGDIRRVQRSASGVRLWGAAKLIGKVSDRWTLGLIEGVTGPQDVLAVDPQGGATRLRLAPPRNFTALRARASLGGASYVGLLATGVTRLDGDVAVAARNHDGYTAGLDWQWQSDGGQLRANGYLLGSQRVGGPARQSFTGGPCRDEAVDACQPITRTDGTPFKPGDQGTSGLVNVTGVSEHWMLSAGAATSSPRLDLNDGGYSTDFNKHQLFGTAGLRDTSGQPGFRTISVTAQGNIATTYDGTPVSARTGLALLALLDSFHLVSIGLTHYHTGQWDTHETLDGARLQKPHGALASLRYGSDSRKPIIVNVGGSLYRDFIWRGHGLGLDGELQVQLFPRLELSLAPSYSFSGNAVRFYDCSDPAGELCSVASEVRRYTFGSLDSGFVSLTGRLAYTFTPTLSFQAYSQLFMARGQYRNFYNVSTSGLRPSIRFSDLRYSPETGDADGDGKQDEDFQETSVNVNLVLRWEFQPGSTLMAVYSRVQEAQPEIRGGRPRFVAQGLSSGSTEDVLLLKLSYFFI